MVYQRELIIDKEDLELCNRMIALGYDVHEEYMVSRGEFEYYEYNLRNGYKLVLRVCIGERAYVENMLLDYGGNCLTSYTSYTLEGEHVLEYGSDIYELTVKVGE